MLACVTVALVVAALGSAQAQSSLDEPAPPLPTTAPGETTPTGQTEAAKSTAGSGATSGTKSAAESQTKNAAKPPAKADRKQAGSAAKASKDKAAKDKTSKDKNSAADPSTAAASPQPDPLGSSSSLPPGLSDPLPPTPNYGESGLSTGRNVSPTGRTMPPTAGRAPALPLRASTQADMLKAQKQAEQRNKAWDAKMKKTMGSICSGC